MVKGPAVAVWVLPAANAGIAAVAFSSPSISILAVLAMAAAPWFFTVKVTL